MASLMEKVTLGWLHSLLCKECPELTRAHPLPSLQADHSRQRQLVPGSLGACAPHSGPGISALSYAVRLACLKIKLPLLIVDSLTTDMSATLRADFGNTLNIAPL